MLLTKLRKCCATKRLYHSRTRMFGNSFPSPMEEEESHVLSEYNAELRNKDQNLIRLIDAYRKNGHRYAFTNPVFSNSIKNREIISLDTYGLEAKSYDVQNLLKAPSNDINDIVKYLEHSYCGKIGVEVFTSEDEYETKWFYQRHEEIMHNEIESDMKILVANELLKSQLFDHFLAKKFVNLKRYGGEGAESLVAFFVEIFSASKKSNFEDIIIGMPHRGRLNFLTGLLGFPYEAVISKIKGHSELPDGVKGAGDVLSHLALSAQLSNENGKPINVSLLPNPSHLEAVNPVVCGKVRGRHLSKNQGCYNLNGDEKMGESSFGILVHGDSAIIGQGINQETLQLAYAPHFESGGTIHIVVNNQIGFTTPPERARSSLYCTCLAKQINAPVLHVNGDFPEDVLRATQLAFEYRKKFGKDIFIDMICYRKLGHNELDDPTFTNPLLYQKIHAKKSVPDMYNEQLIEDGILSKEEYTSVEKRFNDGFEEGYQKSDSYKPVETTLKGRWENMEQASSELTTWDTGMDPQILKYIGIKSVSCDESFKIHQHLKKHHVTNRISKLEKGKNIDWGTAEALAIGSLLYQGFNVRISGQDVGRATFSHRHCMLIDQESNEIHIPLNEQNFKGKLELANSILSEEAVLGFEYGMSIESPNNLVLWEAQFGDFFNGAQIIFDTFVSCGESKWGLQSGLTILLPHGMDGAGPEHSSCRIERFLQMSDSKENGIDGDDVNWHIVYPTNSSQYFHLLRRQLIRNFRKPLIIIVPKVLLRMTDASSDLNAMESGTGFLSVIDDKHADPDKVSSLSFVSGKHYYALKKYQQENNITDTALVCIEQLCPFPSKQLQDIVSKYKNAKRFLWSQEEHRNMGAWSYVSPRFQNIIGVNLTYAGREVLCQPAVGIADVHKKEQEEVLQQSYSKF